jgi:hypothetical protein
MDGDWLRSALWAGSHEVFSYDDITISPYPCQSTCQLRRYEEALTRKHIQASDQV